MGNAPHYFIAIHLPEHLQDFFSVWQDALYDKLPYKQWYNKKDLHITLKFLGAVEEQKFAELHKALKEVKNLPAFNVNVGSIGTFGNPKKPRVLWAGVEKNDNIMAVWKKVEQAAIQVGFPRENREYRPHITLAKKWMGEQAASYDEVLFHIKKDFTAIENMFVDEVTIFQIHPSRSQKYEPVGRYSLKS
ncbi:RNA 2',3'-cyclic phosphodiesterase [Oceanobacillus salinisoli]|uniref:RNA 2',3'-cyclic phosphodiesterase n=1 Tax=Oceanobacillus salinisoli TaxID=2678611 RepID=UPI0012E0EA07|nr:RNA 2',3'-cyclic phosphodiesterase [Oceanobacillus salinisoli]